MALCYYRMPDRFRMFGGDTRGASLFGRKGLLRTSYPWGEEQFLQGKDGLKKQAEPEYWSQLVDNCHQFMHQQKESHRGIHEVRIVNAKTDTLQKYVNVFMMLCFGDSTNEEVIVPMVDRDGRWYMK